MMLSSLSTVNTGQSWQDKIETVRKRMQDNQARMLVITALDEVACKLNFALSAIVNVKIVGLFNMRGSDVDYNPVFFSYAIITPDDIR